MTYDFPKRVTADNIVKMQDDIFDLSSKCQDSEFIVNMKNTQYLSINDLETLLIVKKSLASRGIKFKLINTGVVCWDILTTSGFDRLFKIE